MMLIPIAVMICLLSTQPDRIEISIQLPRPVAEPQRKLDQALLDAIEKGDQARVTTLLTQGANVNAKGINDTALETALFNQQVEIARLLLAKGAKIEAGDLAEAAHGAQGDKEKALTLVKLLLSYLDKEAVAQGKPRADLQNDGPTALRDAALAGNLEVLQLLLDRGAAVNGKDKNGEGVLIQTVRHDQFEPVEMLLNAGADVKAADEHGMTVLMNAARADFRSDVGTRLRLLKLLMTHGADVRSKDEDGRTALHYSVVQYMSESGGFKAKSEIVRLLLENGADVNAPDKRGNTALMDTIHTYEGTAEIPQLLVEKGADVNLANDEGVTPLMFAAEEGRSDVATLLLEKGARLDAKDKVGHTALTHAAEAGRADMVTFLRSKGADLSLTAYKTDADLNAALHNAALLSAVTHGNVAEVRQQLDLGADINARNRNGATSLMWAVEGYKNEIVMLLLDKGANVNAVDDLGNTALMTASWGNNRESVKLLLEHKAETNIVNKEGKTALLLAAQGGHTQVAEQLLARGADFRVRNAEGMTPLLAACNEESAQDELVRMLFAKGADAKAVDNKGNTALMLAARAGAFQVIETLSGAGVDVNARNNDGMTALKLARENKRTYPEAKAEMIKLLQKAGAKD